LRGILSCSYANPVTLPRPPAFVREVLIEVADVQQNGRKANPSYTTIATCIFCGRVSFGGTWQDIGDGLERYLAGRASTDSICPPCSTPIDRAGVTNDRPPETTSGA
jgi:hypothetical protein